MVIVAAPVTGKVSTFRRASAGAASVLRPRMIATTMEKRGIGASNSVVCGADVTGVTIDQNMLAVTGQQGGDNYKPVVVARVGPLRSCGVPPPLLAVDLCDRARETLRSSTTVEDVFAVEPLLVPVCVVDHDRGLFPRSAGVVREQQAPGAGGARHPLRWEPDQLDRFGGGGAATTEKLHHSRAARRGETIALVILEHAVLPVVPGREAEYEEAFAKAKQIIASMPGFAGLTLSRCLERPSFYLLLVQLGAPRGPHRGLPRVGRVPGVAGPAAPLLRAVPGRPALRDGLHRLTVFRRLRRRPRP